MKKINILCECWFALCNPQNLARQLYWKYNPDGFLSTEIVITPWSTLMTSKKIFFVGNQALDGGKGHRSNSVDLKYPILIFLQILEDTSFRVLAANDALPFANASSPLTFSELPEKSPIPLHTQSSRISHSEAESVGDDSPSFWNSAFNR